MAVTATRNTLVEEAVRICGSQNALAEAMTGVGFPCVQQTISKLVNGELRVDADFAIGIDRATGGRISKHALRPDLFDAPRVPADVPPTHANGEAA